MPFETLSSFSLTTEQEISEILNSNSIKSSPNDVLPSHLLKANIHSFIPYLTKIVNLSLLQGSMNGLKDSIITPLIKDKSLDYNDMKNYRPISNIPFISKLIERVVLKRLNNHLEVNNLQCNDQFGYKKFHSTETLLLKFLNDVLICSDQSFCVVVLFIDMSAAFDTVDHAVLLNILQNEIGINGIALSWFKSFLNGRTQRVKIDNEVSDGLPLKYGVPQGSVLGPVLFNIYTRSISSSFSKFGFKCFGYADDNSGMKAFTSFFQKNVLISQVPNCISNLESWTLDHYLQLNSIKTKIMIFGLSSELKSLVLSGTFTNNGNCILFCDCVKHLGVILDKELNLETHTNQLVSSCYYSLRNISQIRKYLSIEQAEQLIHAFISSKLDFSNAILFGMPKHLINKIQRVQNAAMRFVTRKKKCQSVSEDLKLYHWLPVLERINFKVLCYIYKSLYGMAPKSISDLIHINTESRSTGPILAYSDFHPMTNIGKRAFSFFAPRLWNHLPFQLRSAPSIDTFKKQLKTFLFTNFDMFQQRVNFIINII